MQRDPTKIAGQEEEGLVTPDEEGLEKSKKVTLK
jgi:hypothetical protein